MYGARRESIDFRGFDGGEVMFLLGVLYGENAKIDLYGLKVSKVNGVRCRRVVHEIASGVR